MAEFNVVLYTEIGFGRRSPSHQQTVVHKGRLHNSVEFVAAKAIDNQRQEETFRAVEILHKFDHDNIVRFVNWYQTSTKIFVITEYCPGGTLLELLERDVCLPETVIRIFSSDLLAGLLYIHRRGFLYRDFSPRNILLDECGILKYSDFSRAGKVNEPLSIHSVDLEFLEMLPPELLWENGRAMFSSDLYSLGCLMYMMATGVCPFVSQDPEELSTLIRNSQPQPIGEVSNEFNDLVLKMLSKNPRDRPNWLQILKHPWWQDALGNRLDDSFKQCDPTMLPRQPDVDVQQNVQRKSLSTFHVISRPTSTRASARRPSLIMTESTGVEEQGAVLALLGESQLLKPAGVVFNLNIESFPLAHVEGLSISVTVENLKTSDPDESQRSIAKLQAALNGPDRTKTKAGLLSFVIANAKTPDVANNLLNSPLFPDLLTIAAATKHPSIAAGFLLLYGTIIRYATHGRIPPNSFAALESLAAKPQEKILRKAVATVGQIASNVALEQLDMQIPPFTSSVLLKALRSADEPVRHYAIRAVANLLVSETFSQLFPAEVIEPLLLSFDIGQSPQLVETYAICLVAFYKANTPNSTDQIVPIIKTMLGRQIPTVQTLAIMLAAQTSTIPIFKEQIMSMFKNSSGELKMKSFLALCLIARSSLVEFVDVAAKFFQFLDKIQSDIGSEEVYEAVMSWTAPFCDGIINDSIKSSNWELLQIVYQALQSRSIFIRIWTSKFEKKIQKLIRNNPFTGPKSEVALQLVQCALCYQNCDLSIIVDLCRALNSQHATVRFAVMKLVADISSQRPVPSPVVQFTETNIMGQLGTLLQDEAMVVDETLRVVANVCAEHRNLLQNCVKVLPAIVATIADSPAGLDLATLIVSGGVTTLDAMVAARIVPSLVAATDKPEHSDKAIELISAMLTSVADQLSDARQASARRNLVKAVHTLSAVAPKVAARLLDCPKAVVCLSLMIKIFTPQGKDSEVLIESSFNAIAYAITQGLRKPEHAAILGELLKVLQWSAEVSAASRLKLKGAAKLTTAVKKACEQGCDELKQAAAACQRAIRG
jgi:serine/threonine-protein kinase ULK4